ncbi:MAG: nucleotidyltransferase domain-containing protein [Metallibacterium scheffleri]|jgi:predicted nucleotidyltransferase|uniref:nucleotidyltransferase domain-containing protein n=1 Tax=Metallibacterium scheffleri TaxID=993689 RepID=UPI0026ED62DA|nr:nucleotidyltransferase domain-containing protein [Metallibacterium scheffleri]MCK9367465.1 nucleotidyltransferase domain-containing protein [Metallibacterium scheffleri]
MRLTPEQVAIIRSAAAEVFGADARVWLFGSRVDDSKRGGDIDLYLETAQTSASVVQRQARLWSLLQQRLGEQRIDIVVRAAGTRPQPIHEIARLTGVPLA